MKKTHKDRINLIDRLERKYAKKMMLQNQLRKRDVKQVLRTMRGQTFEYADTHVESIDGVIHQRRKIAF